MAGDEHRRTLGGGGQHRAKYEQRRVEDHHPPLRQKLGELHSEDRPDGVPGVSQTEAETHRLCAHVKLPADDRSERL